MTKNSENVSSSCSAAGQKKCTPACLLLFVGFIFGFSVGFASHDVIYKTLSKAMYGNKQLVSDPIPGKHTFTPDGEPVMEDGTTDVEAPQEEEAKPEEAAAE